jgi:hypothetical protein
MAGGVQPEATCIYTHICSAVAIAKKSRSANKARVSCSLLEVLGFILEKKSVPTEMDEFQKISVQFQT